MERTNDGRSAGAPLLRHNPTAAVAANIMEGPHYIVLATHDQGPLPHKIKAVIIADIGNIADMAGKLPGLAEQLVFLDFEELRIGVGPIWQSAPFVVIQPGPDRRNHIHDHLFYIEYTFNIAQSSKFAKSGRQRCI